MRVQEDNTRRNANLLNLARSYFGGSSSPRSRPRDSSPGFSGGTNFASLLTRTTSTATGNERAAAPSPSLYGQRLSADTARSSRSPLTTSGPTQRQSFP